jgi:hypothetical protein
MRKGLSILVLLLALACPGLSFADPVRLVLEPNGKGSFTMTGKNVVGVQALDVEIDYDSSLLENPLSQIVGGELKQVMADAPGKLLISVFRPVTDAILKIILSFDTKSDTEGGINHVFVTAITRSTAKRTPEPDPDPFSSGVADNISADRTPDASSTTRTNEGAPQDLVPKVNPAVVALAGNDGTDAPSTQPGAAPPASVGKNIPHGELAALMREEHSVLERFRKFKGQNGLKAFTAFFEREDENRIVQEPAVALSDGKTPVTLKIKLRQKTANSPDVALFDASLVAVHKLDETTILITVLPSKGTWCAGLALTTGMETVECPLVVAPPVKISGSVNEKNFLAALDKYIVDQALSHGEDNKSYLYKYIFTANYLAMTAKAPFRMASH